MAFDTYAALQAKVIDYLDRTDMTAEVPDWITLCEANIARDLRRAVALATITVSATETTLPGDVAELRSVRPLTATAYQDVPVTICTPLTFAEAAARHNGVAGRPKYGMVLNGKLYVAPAPDQAYDLEIIYFTKLVPLSEANPSNATLLEAPDLYLYGTLMQAEPFLENDDRAGLWKSAYDAAVLSLNTRREREEYGAAPLTARLPRVF